MFLFGSTSQPFLGLSKSLAFAGLFYWLYGWVLWIDLIKKVKQDGTEYSSSYIPYNSSGLCHIGSCKVGLKWVAPTLSFDTLLKNSFYHHKSDKLKIIKPIYLICQK